MPFDIGTELPYGVHRPIVVYAPAATLDRDLLGSEKWIVVALCVENDEPVLGDRRDHRHAARCRAAELVEVGRLLLDPDCERLRLGSLAASGGIRLLGGAHRWPTPSQCHDQR